MGTVAEKIDKVIFKFMYGVSFLAGLSLILAAVLCSVDALSSKIFSFSIPNGTEWVTYLNIPIVFLAMGFIQVERGNTTVDLLSKKFPPVFQKIIQIFSCVLGFAISAFLAYCEFDLTLDKLTAGTKASSAGHSFVIWPFALVIAIGYALVAIAFLWCIFRIILIPPEKWQGAFIMPEPAPEGAPAKAAAEELTPLPDPGLGKLAEEVDNNMEEALSEKSGKSEERRIEQ